MREFMHGHEWWGLRDDGTWVRRPDQMSAGAKTFRWRFRKTLGPFPPEGEASDPNASPEDVRRAFLLRASRRAEKAELWLGLFLMALFIGGILLLLWVIDLGFDIG